MGDDNIESLRKRFTTYKNETMPIVELFRKQGKCVEVDTSQKRHVVYDIVKGKLAPLTESLASKPLADRSQILLGLKPWPKRPAKKGVLWQAQLAAVLSTALLFGKKNGYC